jgi:hypothetical protein
LNRADFSSGGKLTLFEIIGPDILRTRFVLGLLPGWWLSTCLLPIWKVCADGAGTETYRELSPCISEKQWHEVLLQNGFLGVDFTLRDFEDESCHEMGLILSTPTEEVADKPTALDVAIVVETITATPSTVASNVRAHLQSTGNFKCDIITLREAALGSEDLFGQFLIFLPELERSLLYDLESQKFAELKVILSSGRRLLWVTSGGGSSPISPQFSMIDGLASVLR